MNLSSLYKRRFTKDNLLSYTQSIVGLIERRLKDKISKTELADELMRAVNKFLKKYGE